MTRTQLLSVAAAWTIYLCMFESSCPPLHPAIYNHKKQCDMENTNPVVSYHKTSYFIFMYVFVP